MAAKNKPYEQFGPYILFKKLESDPLGELWRAARIENGRVLVDLEDEPDHTAHLPFGWIADAKLVLNDELMKRGAAEREARLAAQHAEEEGV